MCKSFAAKSSKTKRVDNAPVIIDYDTRAVCNQNFSKIVALPKQALNNLGKDIKRVKVQLIQTDTEKFLKLTPIAVENVEDSLVSRKDEVA